MKRPIQHFGEAPAAKFQNVGGQAPEGAPEGSWTCQDCQNVNWPLRTHCNRCKVPGPWNCPACNNKNFQGRQVCNRKQCAQPRPGSFPMQAPMGYMQPPMKGHHPMQQHQQMKGYHPMQTPLCVPMNMQQMNMKPNNPPGSWECIGCQNVNWPQRVSCNKCQIPREQGDSGRDAGTPVMQQGHNSEHPVGSWKCAACENINWPKRTSCKKCDVAREEVDAGPPPPGTRPLPPSANSFGGRMPSGGYGVAAYAMHGGMHGGMHSGPSMHTNGKHPPGSWVCSGCENVNWPLRTACKKCELPRDGADGGPPQVPQKETPEGSWTCPACSNVNWPMRTVCNKKQCGEPRPME